MTPKGNAAGADPDDFRTSYVTNALGALLEQTDPLGAITTRTYDDNGNVASATDADGRTTTYDYDRADQLVAVTRNDASVISSGYDLNGNLISQTDGAGEATTYDYDDGDRLVSVTDPNGRTTSYGYDLAGRRTTLTAAGGGVSTFGYDDADQLVSVSYSDGSTPSVAIDYDAAGRRTDMVDGTGASHWEWDSLGRLVSETDGSGATVGYGYDLADNVVAITYPGSTGTVMRDYDDAGRLVSVTDWDGRTTTFGPDANSNVGAVVYPNDITTAVGFDDADRLVAMAHSSPGATLASFDYGRSDAGLLSSDTPAGVPGGPKSYDYTPLAQLKTAGAGDWSYDDADNLAELASGVTLDYDPANQATALVGAGATTSLAYDSRGNRISATPTVGGGGSTLAYDGADRLSSFDPASFSEVLAGGWYHSLAARADGSAWAWGWNANGQLGNGTTADSHTPTQVGGLEGIVAVGGGAYNSIALAADGTVWAWGWNAVGQLGNGTTTDSLTPVKVEALSGIVAIAAGPSHNLALRDDGSVWAWGYNSNGQLGDGTTTDRTSPVAVSGLDDVVAIAGGYAHSVALRSDGTVWAWGYNGFGQLGNGSTTDSPTPLQVPGLEDIGAITAGYHHTMAVRADTTTWTWGYNAWGQLADGTTNDRSTPGIVIGGLFGVSEVAAGGFHSLALRSDATVGSWGWNGHGQLGIGSTTPWAAPQEVGSSDLVGLATGPMHVLGIHGDSTTVAAWGYNGTGTLGDGSTTDSTTPITLSSFERGTEPRGTYAYDGDGLRVSKDVAGETHDFTWSRVGGLPLLLADGDHTYVYGPGGTPLYAIDAGGDATFMHHDQLGSVRLLTDEAANVVGTFTYDPYGALEASTGTTRTPFGFAGEYRDAESGFVYLRARYYDPTTGQFISRDPLEAVTQEPYGYVGGNPLNMVDPLGLCWGPGCLVEAAVGLAADVGGAVVGTADDVWDATGGRVASQVNDWCFGSWQEAATCSAFVAGTASLGFGGAAVLGFGGGLAGTAGAVSTATGAASLISQGALAVDDCIRGVDASCVVNAFATVAGGLGIGAGYAGGVIAFRHSEDIGRAVATLGLSSALWGLGLGAPGLGGYLDGRVC